MAEDAHRRRWPRRPRPPRAEVDPAALRLLQAHGPKVLATARRYAATPEDAEDAFQRGLEILLTKAPTTDPAELLPWLKTVVKHEAFAIRRQRERATPTTDDGVVADPAGPGAPAHDQAERYERLRQGAEALQRLKPQEIRALLLKAEGYTYREICELTGWTYTKVNRCLTEGRRALIQRLAGIESGIECERLAPLLSALVDGEAGADELRALRPHLRSCLACRTRLREFRSGPARIAAVVPAAALAAPMGARPRGWLESGAALLEQKAALLGERAHAATELAVGPKVAALAASAAVVAGGGAAADRIGGEPKRPPQRGEASGVWKELPRVVSPRPRRAQPVVPERRGPARPAPPPAPAAVPHVEPSPAPVPPGPPPADEFMPAPGTSAGRRPPPRSASEGEFAP